MPPSEEWMKRNLQAARNATTQAILPLSPYGTMGELCPPQSCLSVCGTPICLHHKWMTH